MRVEPHKRSGEQGVALLVVVMAIALITAVVAEFAYNSSVELAAAANFRDELRAHYLLRSSANLSRLLFQIQTTIEQIDRKGTMFGDFQVPHYAPYLIGAFAQKEEAEALGSLLGVQTSGAKGLGLDTGTLDAEILAQDGKVNLNCATSSNQQDKIKLAMALGTLFFPPQFNPLFERADARGEHHDRLEITQALIDWADLDETRWEPEGGSAPEDYGYESLPDPYPSKNSAYDTPGEIELVRGIDEDFIRTFGDALTVWGGCKVNINEADPLALFLLLQLSAQNPEEFENPQRVLEAGQLARFLYDLRLMLGGGVASLDQAKNLIERPEEALAFLMMADGTFPPIVVPPQGIAIDMNKLKQYATDGKRQIWKLTATADVGRVRRRLVAVWNMDQPSQTSGSQGTWIYWREQ